MTSRSPSSLSLALLLLLCGVVTVQAWKPSRFRTAVSPPDQPDRDTAARRTSKPPCCKDMLGSMTCQRLQRLNEQHFVKRCNKDAEFRLIQCCSSCNKYDGITPYDAVAESLVSESCFDRYGANFCQRYVNSTDVWSLKRWSCDGQNPHIAFRSCRLSCGFCDFQRVSYTLQNAVEACKYDKDGWRERFQRRLHIERMNRIQT